MFFYIFLQESKLVDDSEKESNKNKPVESTGNRKKVQVKTFVSLFSKLRQPGEQTDLFLIHLCFILCV